MAQLLNFTESDLLGSVTHVDTEQIIIEIENPLIMGQICVGNLVAIETGKHHELLIVVIPFSQPPQSPENGTAHSAK